MIDFLTILGSNEVLLGGLRNLSEALWDASGPSCGGLRRPLGRVPKTDSPDKGKGSGGSVLWTRFGAVLAASREDLWIQNRLKIDPKMFEESIPILIHIVG